ncbi:MAG: DegV family protein [Lysinibacillus sp.]
MKIAWITDTAPLLSTEFIEQHNIHVLPLQVVFGEEAYRETVDITSKQFYEKLNSYAGHPTSAQPNFGDHVALYERLKEEGYDCAIAIHVSSKQSGTFASSTMAAEQAGFKTYAIDSMIGSHPMQKMLETGIKLAEEGKSIEEIIAAIEQVRAKGELMFIPANLEKLHKSGRVSGTAMFISNLLNIKLVIKYDDGVCVVDKKVRADKRAKQAILDNLNSAIAKSNVTEIAVIHTNDETAAIEWRNELQAMYPSIRFVITELCTVVGALTGEGTVGLSWVRE